LHYAPSSSVEQHKRFLKAVSRSNKNEDKTNRLLSMEKQLQWLRDIGFVDVDCWKWLEPYLSGTKYDCVMLSELFSIISLAVSNLTSERYDL
jgi:hypothetical protein